MLLLSSSQPSFLIGGKENWNQDNLMRASVFRNSRQYCNGSLAMNLGTGRSHSPIDFGG